MLLSVCSRWRVATLLLVSTALSACGGDTIAPTAVSGATTISPTTIAAVATSTNASIAATSTSAPVAATRTTAPVAVTRTTAPVAATSTTAPVAPTVTTIPVAKNGAHMIGEAATLKDLRVTVNEVKTVAGTDFFKPKAGMKFVVVNVTLENTGSEAANVSSLLQMEVKDATGQAYDESLSADSVAGGKVPGGSVAPGDKLRGSMGYEVPTDVEGLQWIFKEAFGSDRIVFDVSKTGAVAVVSSTATSDSSNTGNANHKVGDAVTLGSLKVTLNAAKTVAGKDYFKPKAGMKFVVVNVTLENTGSEAENVSSLLQMEIKDATGQAYDESLSADSVAGGKVPGGSIAPGDKLRGAVGYEVPTNVAGLQWIFKEAFGSERVVFDIKP